MIQNKGSWQKKGNTLKKTYTFKNFLEAIRYIQEIALICESMNHHPHWSNIYNTISITLTTHDALNTITAKDRELAQKMDEVFRKYIV